MSRSNPETTNLKLSHQDVLHMLKNGRGEELQSTFQQMQKANYPNEFLPFMETMIREHRLSRKAVAIRSGLSQDYLYKLLRGDKHTDERDYILAICIAIGMNLPQTQHALASYGMPVLDDRDIRSHIIILAIRNGDGMDEVNRMLENAGYPLLKTSPDMPSAPIRIILSPEAEPEADAAHSLPDAPKKRKFRELDSGTDAEHNGGGAPFDYDYRGWITVEDESGKQYHVEALFSTEFNLFTVCPEAEYQKVTKAIREKLEGLAENADLHDVQQHLPQVDPLESYETLVDASSSEFFPFFLKIDEHTDQKVLEVMNRLDDTREFGCRIGSAWHGGEEPKVYIEMFNNTQPELREYFQIVEYRDGKRRYTASHESCYMQIEMGRELYEAYFGSLRRSPEYYIDTDRNEFSGKDIRYRFIFNMIQSMLHEQILQADTFIHLDPEEVREEKIEVLIEQGVMMQHRDDPQTAIRFFREALQLQESQDLSVPENLLSYVCTCFKLAVSLAEAEDPEAERWYRKVIGMKDRVLSFAAEDSDAFRGAVTDLAFALQRELYRDNPDKDKSAAMKKAAEILQLIDQYRAAEEDWPLQLNVRGLYAWLIEDVDLEESLRQYRLAVNLSRDHHLDQYPACAYSVAMQYNNYAWMLWNKCGREDAVFYYGRAIELLESYLVTGVIEKEITLPFLKHVGEALNKLYLHTGRIRESDGLKQRLQESGISLD